jgi:hypothetical protein
MAEYNFNEDIHVGEAGEKIVIRDLESLGLKFISDNKNHTHDVIMEKQNGDMVSYEIKTDVLIKPDMDTLNMFIEFESRGNPSGISTTQAEWFVMFFKHLREVWYIRTKDLKELLAETNCRITEMAGDLNSNTKGYLLPRYVHQKKFIVRRIPKAWID